MFNNFFKQKKEEDEIAKKTLKDIEIKIREGVKEILLVKEGKTPFQMRLEIISPFKAIQLSKKAFQVLSEDTEEIIPSFTLKIILRWEEFTRVSYETLQKIKEYVKKIFDHNIDVDIKSKVIYKLK